MPETYGHKETACPKGTGTSMPRVSCDAKAAEAAATHTAMPANLTHPAQGKRLELPTQFPG